MSTKRYRNVKKNKTVKNRGNGKYRSKRSNGKYRSKRSNGKYRSKRSNGKYRSTGKKWTTAIAAAQKTLEKTGSVSQAKASLRKQALRNARALFATSLNRNIM
jgi:hypothetical protein